MNSSFIDNDYIIHLLDDAKTVSHDEINRILDKAESFSGLTHREVAALLATKEPTHINRIFSVAGKIKEHIYGDRIVMFAPLYISDYCVNKCSYCGFKCDNSFERRKLTMDEIRDEVKILVRMGHKRIALEAGEDPVNCGIDYIVEAMQTIYEAKSEVGEIRRINVNIASTTVEDYRKLKAAGIGTYILFQETYHRPTYEQYHLAGPKRSYDYHITAFNRAMEAGIDDVGGGVLFGLYDPCYEILGYMLHNEYLEQKFGVGFHTVSVPRICKAEGTSDNSFPYAVDDSTFKRLVAILRIAIPFTGMIISTRETPEMRRELIKIGISQISGGSSVDVGGYTAREQRSNDDVGQFQLADSREAADIIRWIIDEGLVPSFCTACYRSDRTGDRFMSLAKSGNIKNVCLPNALMTLWEYAHDFGDDEFKVSVKKIIDTKVNEIVSEKIRHLTVENLNKIQHGDRDLFL